MSRDLLCDACCGAGEWETHRVPLVEEIRTTKDSVAKRKADMKYTPAPLTSAPHLHIKYRGA